MIFQKSQNLQKIYQKFTSSFQIYQKFTQKLQFQYQLHRFSSASRRAFVIFGLMFGKFENWM